MRIGDRIKKRRKELKMSADDLAERLGKNRSTVYRYEAGEIENMPLDILEELAAALKTSPAYLMGWEKEEKKNDIISNAVVRMRTDEDYLSVVETLYKLDNAKLSAVKQMLRAFL